MGDKEMLLDFQNRYHGALERIKELEGSLEIAVEALEYYKQRSSTEASKIANEALSKIKETE